MSRITTCRFVCLSVHRCICVEKKTRLDVIECFIELMICSTCFGHFHPHHQELETICVCYYRLWCAVLVCWLSGVRCRAAGCVSRPRDFVRRAASLVQQHIDINICVLRQTVSSQNIILYPRKM